MILLADLELLLIKMSTLESLILDKGVNSCDRRDDIRSENHKNAFRRVEILFSGDGHDPYLRIRHNQLCWLVR